VEGNWIRYEIDSEAFEEEVKNVSMFLLCHPHNPVGKIFSPAELRRMAETCLEHNVTIVSDEIHAELLLGESKFKPLASLSPEIAANTVTLISAAKTFNLSGLACAFAIIPDEKLRRKFCSVAESMSIEVSTPGLTAAHVAFSGKADGWLKNLCRYLTENRDFVIRFLKSDIPGIQMTIPEATYLLWLDCSALKLKPSPFEFFLNTAKVAFSNGAGFGTGCEQYIRLNFGTTHQVLAEALERVRKSLQ
jgi:cystathionine beta-lyase